MKQRVITAAIGIPIVLAALLAPTPWAWGVLVAMACGLCQLEGSGLIPPKADRPLVALIFLANGLQCYRFTAVHHDPTLLLGESAFGVCMAVLTFAAGRPKFLGTDIVAYLGLGFTVMTAAAALIFGQQLELGSINAALLAMVPIWAGDTAAIFAGKAWGRHKLAPEISPNKTWEGSIANLLACIAASFALGIPNHVSPLACGLVGLSTGILGQLGDLYESLLKRRAGVKDSGTLLPGHGGMYDRLDSLMMSAAPSVLILIYLR